MNNFNCTNGQTVEAAYEPFLRRPWVTEKWHFNLNDEITPLDIVSRVNSSLLQGLAILNNDDALFEVVETLIELNAGSTAYIFGLFLGYTASQLAVHGDTPADRAWVGTAELTEMVQAMACGDDGAPHSADVILDKTKPVFQYLKPILCRILSVMDDDDVEILKEEEEFLIMSVMIGNPLPNGNPPPTTYKDFKQAVALRIQDTILSLLLVGSQSPEITGLPVGKNFVELVASFNANLNKNVLSGVESSHAIDGRKFPLFDCRYVPGFGFSVARGLTVWTTASNCFWMSTILLRFSEIMQDRGWMGAATYHLECTELFSFTPFFQELGVPVVDGVNSLLIASRSTDAPMRFVNFKQHNGQPCTPSALVADVSEDNVFGTGYYRDEMLRLRTPTMDGNIYKTTANVYRKLMKSDKTRWKKIQLARPRFGCFNLSWGFESYKLSKPSDNLYPASSALDMEEYVEKEDLAETPNTSAEHFVQYAPSDGRDNSNIDITDRANSTDKNFHSFFGGDLYRDRKVGRKSVACLAGFPLMASRARG